MNKMMQKYTSDARQVWNLLNGIFMVYKPPGIHFLQVKQTVLMNLCKELNEMDVREPYDYVTIDGATNQEQEMRVSIRKSYADHPLVVGPRYVEQDMKFASGNYVSRESSGILVCGINDGTKIARKLTDARLTEFYKVKGILGQARDNHFATGRIVEKSAWKHIKRGHIDRICAAMQASHQKKMFELNGVDIQSQEAYDLAVKGPIRPTDYKVPMLYTIRCIDFQPPEFTIEIVCVNKHDSYLGSLVADIGYRLKSTAHCSYIQCSQYGLFNIKDALLTKHWDLQNIVSNIGICNKILASNQYMLKPAPNLVEKTEQTSEVEQYEV